MHLTATLRQTAAAIINIMLLRPVLCVAALCLTPLHALAVGSSASRAAVGRGGRGPPLSAFRSDGRGGGRGSPRGKGRGTGSTSRRGANREWYARRAEGDPAARRRRGPRPKKWEREGDALYAEVNSDPSIHFRGLSPSEARTKAEAMLAALAAPDDAAPPPPPAAPPPPTSPAMWGACSVGPVLRGRLEAAGMASPLPIQEAAFTPISKGRNVVLASATGSGKTLAFLLPLLTAMRREASAQVLVVTPSIELTTQLQRECDALWPPSSDGSTPSAVHVVGQCAEEFWLHPAPPVMSMLLEWRRQNMV